MKTKFVVAMTFGIFFCGCASTASVHYLNEGITAGSTTSAATIKVYAERSIGREYIELGSVSASLNGELDGKKYIARIKEEAAKIGADAIVGYEQFGISAVGIAVKFR